MFAVLLFCFVFFLCKDVLDTKTKCQSHQDQAYISPFYLPSLNYSRLLINGEAQAYEYL